MIIEPVQITQNDLRKLLGASSPDAALLYLYISAGNSVENAEAELNMSNTRLSCAGATLRQLGLWQEEKKVRVAPGESPSYSEKDVLEAMDSDRSFRILLGFVRYLGLPEDVISVLITYCKDRARQRGNLRSPSLRAIEREAYAWAEQGIDTMEEAAAYIHNQSVRASRLGRLTQLLQIRGRNLTPAEERYALSWLEMNFDEACITMAYERTCLNKGGLNWAYMNRILLNWHQQGLHTAEAVRSGDRKDVPKGASGQLGQADYEIIQKMLREE